MSIHSMDSTPQTPLGLMSGGDVYTSYKAFNVSYMDTGVFGKNKLKSMLEALISQFHIL